jgi:hypothetical protein
VRAAGSIWEIQSTTQVDGRDDLTAEIDESADRVGGQGHPGRFLMSDDFLHTEHVDPESVSVEAESADLSVVGHG